MQPLLTSYNSSVTVPILTKMAIKFQGIQKFIGDDICPVIPVPDNEGTYYSFPKGPWRRDSAGERGPSQRAPRGGYTLSKTAYATRNWTQAKEIPDEELRRARALNHPAIQPFMTATQFCKNQVQLRKEIELATAYFGASVWTGMETTLSGNDQWNNYDTSDPLGNADTAKDNLRKKAGVPASQVTCLMGVEVYDKLVRHSKLRTQFDPTFSGNLDAEKIRQIFGVKRVVVGEASYETSAEGAASEVNGYIWGKYCLFMYIPDAPAIDQPSATYQFRVEGSDAITTWREEAEHQAVVEYAYDMVPEITSAICGAIYINAVG